MFYNINFSDSFWLDYTIAVVIGLILLVAASRVANSKGQPRMVSMGGVIVLITLLVPIVGIVWSGVLFIMACSTNEKEQDQRNRK